MQGGVNLAAALGCLGAILGLSWGVWEQQENLQSAVGSFLVPVLGLLELLFAVGSPACRFLKLAAPSPVSVHVPAGLSIPRGAWENIGLASLGPILGQSWGVSEPSPRPAGIET